MPEYAREPGTPLPNPTAVPAAAQANARSQPAADFDQRVNVALALAAALAGIAATPLLPHFAPLLAALGVVALALMAWPPRRRANLQAKAKMAMAEPRQLQPVTAVAAEAPDLAADESFRDMQWELREKESRLQDLLDRQQDVILRLDRDGRLLFFNRSFERLFSGRRGSIGNSIGIGHKFAPAVIAGDPTADDVAGSERRRMLQCLDTTAGHRWFAWEEQLIGVGDGDSYEIQRVGRDVTEERQAEADLQEARDLAEAASRAKSRFLAVVSHEIRTPMNGILGMTALLLGTELSSDQSTFARAIRRSAQTLLSLIDEILDFSKIEAGKLRLEAAPFTLVEVVQDVVELLAPRAHEKALEIGWSIDPDLPVTMIGDANRLRQVLTNLIGNAVKFTASGGVEIAVLPVERAGSNGSGDCDVAFTVRDTGIGLSADAQQAIFDEFVQADSTSSRRFGGTGLGLAISRRLVQLMGGDIDVVSAPESGATFRAVVRLAVALPAIPVRCNWPLLGGHQRVLVSSNHVIEGEAIVRTLASLGHRPRYINGAAVVSDIRSAVAAGDPYHSILVDPASFAALAAELRELTDGVGERPHELRIVVMIEPGERGLLAALSASGCDGYLVRPIRPQSLLMQLHRGRSGEEAAQRIPATIRDGEALQTNQSAVEPPTGGRVKPRVLLAEDNDINAMVAERMLLSLGLDVTRVTDGRLALAAVRQAWKQHGERDYALVLMDIQMPEMDGLTATREIRRLAVVEKTPAPPIIALTANAFAEDRRHCLEAGMDDFLAKPFDRSHLEELVGKWISATSPLPAGGIEAGAATARRRVYQAPSLEMAEGG